MSIARVMYWPKEAGVGIWGTFLKLQRAILVLLSLVLAFGMFIQVWLRYVFKLPLLGIEEMIMLAAFWLYFLGGVYGAYERSHIKAELIHLILGPRALAVVSTMVTLIALGLGCVLSVWGFNYVMWSIAENPESAIFRIPMVYVQSSIFVGFVLISFYSLFELIDKVRTIFQVCRSQKYPVRG